MLVSNPQCLYQTPNAPNQKPAGRDGIPLTPDPLGPGPLAPPNVYNVLELGQISRLSLIPPQTRSKPQILWVTMPKMIHHPHVYYSSRNIEKGVTSGYPSVNFVVDVA